jgi:transcriptional regulator with XRE-family HTH domain|tara:strand:- start:70 stop:462 length:393 start_codon:yes stop_codon:yes gene_type:complete
MSKQSEEFEQMVEPSADHTFGYRLRYYRLRADLSQSKLSVKCGWSTANARVGNYEQDKREPTLGDIAILASNLGVTPEELAYGGHQLDQRRVQLSRAVIATDTILQAIADKGTTSDLIAELEAIARKISD